MKGINMLIYDEETEEISLASEEIVDTGDEFEFTYNDKQYIGYPRYYADESFDVEVYLKKDPEADAEEGAFDKGFDLYSEAVENGGKVVENAADEHYDTYWSQGKEQK